MRCRMCIMPFAAGCVWFWRTILAALIFFLSVCVPKAAYLYYTTQHLQLADVKSMKTWNQTWANRDPATSAMRKTKWVWAVWASSWATEAAEAAEADESWNHGCTYVHQPQVPHVVVGWCAVQSWWCDMCIPIWPANAGRPWYLLYKGYINANNRMYRWVDAFLLPVIGFIHLVRLKVSNSNLKAGAWSGCSSWSAVLYLQIPAANGSCTMLKCISLAPTRTKCGPQSWPPALYL